MFSSKWIASLSVLITLKKIKSITKHREKNIFDLLSQECSQLCIQRHRRQFIGTWVMMIKDDLGIIFV